MGKTAPRKRKQVKRKAPSRKAKQENPRQRKKSVGREYLEAILVAVALALFLRTFVVQAFRIPSGSMEDTLLVGDFLLANKFIYGAKIPFTDIRLPGIRDPKPGDIIIFQYPRDPDRDFIKRVVAGPGQTVKIRDKILYIDNNRSIDPPHSKYTDPIVQPESSAHGVRDNLKTTTVPPNHYFVMGDNRDNSEDSRYWGFLPDKLIRGKAFILYYSWASDPEAPDYKNIFSIPKIIFYNTVNAFNRTRWSRIGMLVE